MKSSSSDRSLPDHPSHLTLGYNSESNRFRETFETLDFWYQNKHLQVLLFNTKLGQCIRNIANVKTEGKSESIYCLRFGESHFFSNFLPDWHFNQNCLQAIQQRRFVVTKVRIFLSESHIAWKVHCITAKFGKRRFRRQHSDLGTDVQIYSLISLHQ